MLSIIVKWVEQKENYLKEIMTDILGMSHNVESHVTSIKHLEQQLSQMSTTLNQYQQDTLSSSTIQNPKMMVIT